MAPGEAANRRGLLLMASQYGISESDLTPDRIPANVYEELTDYDADGTPDVTILDVIERAENELNALVGGMFVEAANIAVAKPFVELFCVYSLQRRRAQHGDYKIPESVVEDWKMAVAWAKGDGRELLAGEGTVSPAGRAGGAKYSAPDSAYGMTQLGQL